MSVKKAPRARPKHRRPLAPVVSIGGAQRPEDVLKWINQLLSNADQRPDGVMILSVRDGDVDVARVFGSWTRDQILWAAVQLGMDAVTG